MHRQHAERIAVGLDALDIAIVPGDRAVAHPSAQLVDELVQIAARARDLGEQQLDQVPRVGQRALATAEDEGSLGVPAVVDELPEE